MFDFLIQMFKMLLDFYKNLSDDSKDKIHKEAVSAFEKIFRDFFKATSAQEGQAQ